MSGSPPKKKKERFDADKSFINYFITSKSNDFGFFFDIGFKKQPVSPHSYHILQRRLQSSVN
ncbi:MAG TPA: hypothetical protein VGB37_08955 [Candidatus Lokiarchaeia archaeon]